MVLTTNQETKFGPPVSTPLTQLAMLSFTEDLKHDPLQWFDDLMNNDYFNKPYMKMSVLESVNKKSTSLFF